VLTALILAALAVMLLRRRPRLRIPARLKRAGIVGAGIAVLAADPALVPAVLGLALAAALTMAGSLGLVALAARHGGVVIAWEAPGGAR
jgi:hypothetical protein